MQTNSLIVAQQLYMNDTKNVELKLEYIRFIKIAHARGVLNFDTYTRLLEHANREEI